MREILLPVIFLMWLSASLNAQNAQNDRQIRSPTNESLQEVVSKLRVEQKLIGLGAMFMVDGKTIAVAVDGKRKKGGKAALEVGDRWHIGSITKSITATMIARLVEREELTWSTTVADCFGESMSIHADWQIVTLAQLLTHTSGAPPNFPLTTQFKRPAEGKERMDARRAEVLAIFKKKPRSEAGESFKYSNVGFTIAGAMAEKQTGIPWETLVRREIFNPLEIKQAGFGPPKDANQPRGHQNIGFFKRVAGVEEDNTPIMGPAGTVHMTLADLCTFGNDHVRGETGKGKLLTAKSYRSLHTAKLNNYAFGWVVPKKNSLTDQRMIWHNGSNTLWYALLVLLPDRNAVISVTSNDGDIRRAEAAAFQIVKEFADQL
jgi:CubicO group peptidase (beta-lactamase class C family)